MEKIIKVYNEDTRTNIQLYNKLKIPKSYGQLFSYNIDFVLAGKVINLQILLLT